MDIVGCTFGKLKVTAFSHKNSVGRFYWSCQCSCGGNIVTSGTALRMGGTKSCGCISRAHMRALHAASAVYIGGVYGRLTVTDFSHANTRGRLFWECLCSCGNSCVVAGTNMRIGATVSCGCARKGANATHGGSKTLAYSSWISMLHRCENPKRTKYADHGGRGITVCRRWHKFENFLADMGERAEGLTLERRDNNKGYSKRNCVWATRKVQARNRRNSVQLTYNGETRVLSAWAELRGLTASTLGWRRQQGWSDSEIINGRN